MAISSFKGRVKKDFTTLKLASWMGWQIESNWTNPLIFAIYAIIKPLAATLILVFIFIVATGGEGSQDMFDFMYIGNAFYMYVAQVLFGISSVIHEEREHYETLKYVYTSPINFYIYLVGRGFAKVVFTTVAVVITLLFGVFVLGVNITPGTVSPVSFLLVFLMGLLGIMAFGITMAAFSLITARHDRSMNEVFSGIFYLFSGVMYPISVLPDWCQSISRWLPVTYWLEAVRRTLLGQSKATLPTMMESYTYGELLLVLAVSTIFFYFLSVLIFRFSDSIARKKGLVDMHTAY